MTPDQRRCAQLARENMLLGLEVEKLKVLVAHQAAHIARLDAANEVERAMRFPRGDFEDLARRLGVPQRALIWAFRRLFRGGGAKMAEALRLEQEPSATEAQSESWVKNRKWWVEVVRG